MFDLFRPKVLVLSFSKQTELQVSKKFLISAIVVCTVAASCKKDGAVGPQSARDDAAFTRYESNFLDGLWKLEPDCATLKGYHKVDSLLTIPDDKNREKLLYYAKLQIDSLSSFQTGSLSESNKIDYQIIQNQMEYLEWQLQELRPYEWDPTTYNLAPSFAGILKTPYAPLPKRLRNFYERMAFLPDYYKEAEKSIHNPAKEMTALAIAQIQGSLDIFGKEFADSLKKSNIPQPEQKQILDRATASAGIVKGFVTWLQNLKNDHPHSFRLGRELYEAKFKYEIQSNITPQQLYDAAVEQKKHLQAEMAKLSKQLWPKYFGNATVPPDSLAMIAKVIDTLSASHAKAANFQQAIENNIQKLTAFIRTKNLAAFSPSQPLVVRKKSPSSENPAVSGFNAPAPYDNKSACYLDAANITGMPPEQGESYLREYNNYTLQFLCMDEAVPGQYLQYSYASKSPDLIKLVFQSSPTIEGWAGYSEKMMLDSGYEKQSAELNLMWYKWRLRAICSTIMDYSVHEQNMSRQDALKLLTGEAFEQEPEAERQWQRVTETSVHLDSYFAGYREISDLRNAYQKQKGDKFSLKDFNEKFLNYGYAPVSLIKAAMLAPPKQSSSQTGN